MNSVYPETLSMTQIELHIHVKTDNKLLINPERIKLLKIINNTGSLLNASKKMKISYNKAWLMLDSMNKASNKMVVEKVRGGKGGGGASITDFGKTVLKEFDLMESVVNKFCDKLNTEINI